MDGGSDGGASDDGGSDDGGSEPVISCATKYDCPEKQICLVEECVPASGNCTSSAQCPRGQVCAFTGKCIDGCEDGRDCRANELCHPNRDVCETCSVGNPCPSGEVCLNEQCVTAANCTSSSECAAQAPGTVCENGACLNCTSHSSCNVSPYNDGDTKRTVCATDGMCRATACEVAECESRGPQYFCNTLTGSCDLRECTTDGECLLPGTVCHPLTYRCEVPGNCQDDFLSSCQTGCQAQGRLCDELRCTCYQGADMQEPCVDDQDCAQGLYCMLGLCDEKCVLDGSGGFVGSRTGRTCDFVMCFFSETFFGMQLCQ